VCDDFTNQCMGCNDGFYLDNVTNECKKCSGACLKCSSPDTCDLCEGEGEWAKTENGQCTCIKGWDAHPDIAFKCQCNSEYVSLDYACQSCQQLIPGCLKCVGDESRIGILTNRHPDKPAQPDF
jgi:hypothetical protein